LSEERSDEVLGYLILIGIYAVPAIVTFMKGKIGLGLLGFLVQPLWWGGALRLAKPDSPWARRFYGPEKMAAARERFAPPAGAPGAPTPAPVPSFSDPASARSPVAVEGLADSSYGCSVCGDLFEDRERAIRHVAGRHGELYEDPRHGLVEVGVGKPSG
jgi:hypothetical protein